MAAPLTSFLKFFRFICWLGVALWVATIFYLSSRSGEELSAISWAVEMWDKLLHFSAFFCGALPLVPSLRLSTDWSWGKIAWCSVAFISLYGALDEAHQLWTPSRSGLSMGDWLADTLGAVAGTVAAIGFYRYAERNFSVFGRRDKS